MVSLADDGALSGLEIVRERERRYGPDVMRDIVAIYLKEATAQIAALKVAAETANWRTAERTAHSMKSSAAAVGAELVADVCRRIEVSGKSAGVGELLPPLVELLCREHESAAILLKAYLAELNL